MSISIRLTHHIPKFEWNCNGNSLVIISTILWTSLAVAACAKQILPTSQNLDIRTISSTNNVNLLDNEYKLAQWFYPKTSEGQNIQVIGIGRASQPADRATFGLLFTPKIESPSPEAALSQKAENSSSEATLSQFNFETREPLTLDDIEPIVDALIAAGISESAIETKIAQPTQRGLPFPFPSTDKPGGAAVVIYLDTPTPEDLDNIIEIVQAVEQESDNLSLSSAKVEFELDDCTTLEQNGYQAAVSDGKNRAEVIAESIGATLDIPSVSEPFYSPVLPGCSLETIPFLNQPQTYEPGMKTDLEVIRQLFFTYPILSEPR